MGTICGWEMPAALCFPPSMQMLLYGVCSPPLRYYSSHPSAVQSNPKYLRRLFSGWAQRCKAAAAHYSHVT